MNNIARLRAAAVATALMCASTWVQAQTITVYQNDFENPSTTACSSWGGTARDSNAASEYTGSTVIQQLQSVDRLCINPTPAPTGTYKYADPTGKAGKYAIGFYGSNRPAVTEAFALAIDPQGRPSVTTDVDLSIVKIANYSGTVNANAAANITVNFYKLPAGETYSLSPPPPWAIPPS